MANGIGTFSAALAGRQGRLGGLARKVIRRQAAGKSTEKASAALGRTLGRRTAAGGLMQGGHERQIARGQRWIGRTAGR